MHTPFSTLTFGPKAYDGLPPAVRAECYPAWDGRYNLHLQSWSMAEMNVPDYPAVRVHVGDRHPDALAEQLTGGGEADSGVGAGHQGGAAGDVEIHACDGKSDLGSGHVENLPGRRTGRR